ncbi:pilus assembly protein N-terminal domain-containing protein [Polycladidibacter hongkongensis]|uniref:pilus assembly protein N-terminal domain-containing protein n=1 Tax=Polycladidibacter hongkongensis TaxID=1647556 RepID=UPI00083691B3|nr:pilus assembly protein N-terminal domain-containing protein [Pseudovibrio hongkongensis]
MSFGAAAKQICVAVSVIVAISSSLATAAEVAVQTDQAKVFRTEEPAKTVIIGNPMIAEVTIHDGSTVIITGKANGRTNLIILNERSEPIVDEEIVVSNPTEQVVMVQRNTNRSSYSCEPICQPTVQLGDDTEFLGQTLSSILARDSAAVAGQ